VAKQYASPPAMTIDASKTYTATIETSAGTMVAELLVGEAPRRPAGLGWVPQPARWVSMRGGCDAS
jgi:hypothetical protein